MRAHLEQAAGAARDRSAGQRFRLAVDRVFTLSGVGVVATGTVLSGSVHLGDRIQLSPSGLFARVRSLHAQNRPAEAAQAGERCALNLTGPGITKDAIRRGDVALDPELHAPTDRSTRACAYCQPKKSGRPMVPRQTSSCSRRSRRAHRPFRRQADRSRRRGQTSSLSLTGQLPQQPMTASSFGTHRPSERWAAACSLICVRKPEGGGRRKGASSARPSRWPIRRLPSLRCWKRRRSLLTLPRFAARSGALRRAGGSAGIELGSCHFGVEDSNIALTPERWPLFASTMIERIGAYHGDNPDLQGLGREQLRTTSQPKLPKPAFDVALNKLAGSRQLVLDGAFVRLPSHEVRLAPEDSAAWEMIAPLLGGSSNFRPPRVRDLAAATGRSEKDLRRTLKRVGRMGWADEVAHDHFFLRPTFSEMTMIIADLSAAAKDGSFSAAQFRDQVDNGRKVAIQILDFFDRHGVTLRKGDARRINPHRLDLFGATCQSDHERGGNTSSPWGARTSNPCGAASLSQVGSNSHSLPPTLPGHLTSNRRSR